MDWQAIGAVGEILGAVGVIITLGYLASQIKHARESQAQRAAQHVWDLNAGFVKSLSEDTDACRIFRLGMAGDASLTLDESLRFRVMVLDFTYVWQRIWEFDQEGMMTRSLVDSNVRSRRELMAAPGW